MKLLKTRLRRFVFCQVACYIHFQFLLKPVFNLIMLLQVVKLLAYISDKDLFAEFYRFISHSEISYIPWILIFLCL